MCEIAVYLEQDGTKEKLMEDVARIEIKPDGVVLRKTFKPPREVRAAVREIDALEHTIALTPLPPKGRKTAKNDRDDLLSRGVK
jgi:predicted RNA-binding protein